MILSRAPCRVSLGGGGTDLPSYYGKHGGFLISGAINKYCTVMAYRRFYDSLHLVYSEMETVNSVNEIKHRILKAALRYIEVGAGIEIYSAADVPAGSGLGSSSSFTVALLNALHTYRKEFVPQRQLAEEAYKIETLYLEEPIGKQDQYIAAFGGLTCLTFEPNGSVLVEPLRISPTNIDELENSLIMFFTGKERSASELLKDQDTKSQADDAAMIANLDKTKDIGLQTRRYLEEGHLEMLGELFHAHWENKRQRSTGITNTRIDECYELARKNGALGGKLIGAGGGGFLMFYCNGGKSKVIQAMQKAGLRWERFRFDFEGAKILWNG